MNDPNKQQVLEALVKASDWGYEVCEKHNLDHPTYMLGITQGILLLRGIALKEDAQLSDNYLELKEAHIQAKRKNLVSEQES